MPNRPNDIGPADHRTDGPADNRTNRPRDDCTSASPDRRALDGAGIRSSQRRDGNGGRKQRSLEK